MASETRKCVQCGNPIPKGRRAPTCGQECAMKRMLDCIDQMMHRDGPYYEKWLQGCMAGAEKYRSSQAKALANYQETMQRLQHNTTPVGIAEQIIRAAALDQALREFEG